MSKNRKYPDTPILGVGAVVFRGDMILLVKRGKEPYKGQWSLPGGKQKISETVFEAVKRELHEETRIKVKNLELIDVTDIILPDEQGKIIFHYTIIGFKAQWLSGECRAGGDSKSVKWFNIEKLNRIKFPKKTKRIIDKALEKKKFS